MAKYITAVSFFGKMIMDGGREVTYIAEVSFLAK